MRAGGVTEGPLPQPPTRLARAERARPAPMRAFAGTATGFEIRDAPLRRAMFAVVIRNFNRSGPLWTARWEPPGSRLVPTGASATTQPSAASRMSSSAAAARAVVGEQVAVDVLRRPYVGMADEPRPGGRASAGRRGRPHTRRLSHAARRDDGRRRDGGGRATPPRLRAARRTRPGHLIHADVEQAIVVTAA